MTSPVSKETAEVLAAAFSRRSVVEIDDLVHRFVERTSESLQDEFIQFAGEVWSLFCTSVGEEIAARGVTDCNDFVRETNAALSEAITCPNCDQDALVQDRDQRVCPCGYSETL